MTARRALRADHVHKGGAVFDRDRLEWLNGQWIRRLADEDLVERLLPFLGPRALAGRIERMPDGGRAAALLPIIRERLPTLPRSSTLVGFLWVDELGVDPPLLVPKRWDAATRSPA